MKNLFYSCRLNVPDVIRRLLLFWLLAVTVEYTLLPDKLQSLADTAGLAQMSLIRILALTCAGTIFLSAVSALFLLNTARLERFCLVGAFALLAALSLRASFTWAFLAACILLLAILITFAIKGWDSRPDICGTAKIHSACLWITGLLAIAFFLFISTWTVGRVYSFCSPTYDFGIFSQMFYSMKTRGLPITTLERDGALSHFAVHVSPIYYLMLPFYCLFPAPATLQVLQALVMTSAVLPLLKIGKQHGLTGMQIVLLCALLLLYPAFSGGSSYDIHENCFLTPLILWLFYSIDREKRIAIAVMAILTLMVKEDAAVYVAVIALWLIISRKDLIAGSFLLALSLIWFFLVTGYLAHFGDGVMTYRYSNFLYDEQESLVTVIKAVILNPMKLIYECTDTEKLGFLALTFLTLLGLPLLTRHYERYLLLIPYVLINLMSDYPYQHNIFFQYTFGSTAFLLYLTVVNLAELKARWLCSLALSAALLVNAVCFSRLVVPKALYYPLQAIRHYDNYQPIRDVLAKIPEHAAVTATTFYTTCLSQRDTLYDLKYCDSSHLLSSDYIVLQPSLPDCFEKYAAEDKNGYDNLTKLLEESGYRVLTEIEEELVIYGKTR